MQHSDIATLTRKVKIHGTLHRSKRHEIYVRQAEPGIEPGSRDLQSPALPLCYQPIPYDTLCKTRTCNLRLEDRCSIRLS